ncbi:G-protein coupled receptor GRL101-like [Lytechinus variegatus]|uniref:G-protein coupled receptor GRL101-like n=1 Tax=Lytechinus variegatus TaxID=7654 RepID=UPI001BB27538|nr:G-protein coupled receptor GRL101-like [Lytechinus variegatus]
MSYSSDKRICCLLTEIPNTTCHSTSVPDPLDTCGALFPNTVLRVASWLIGLSALVGNFAVIILRLRDGNLRSTVVQNNFMIGLAVADGLMGLYMLIISSADIYYGGIYFLSAQQWRESPICNFAGFLGFVSSESSVFMLMLITVDRLICILNPFSHIKIKKSSSFCLICATCKKNVTNEQQQQARMLKLQPLQKCVKQNEDMPGEGPQR